MNITKAIFSQMNNHVPLLTLACLLAMPATAQVYYVVSGGTAYVASSPNASGNIVIASTYAGYPVTRIGGGAFAYCFSLASVTIPNSVTSIGGNAFHACSSLTNVTIPNSVTNFELNAFANCTSLTSVTIPDSVTSIGYATFYFCASLTSVTIPDSVTSIGVDAFAYCTSLTNFSVDAANSVYSSVDGALFDKAQTTLLELPGGGGGSYAIPTGVTSVGDSAFAGCASLTSVTIPNSVNNIGVDAFYGCSSLTSLTIPNSVTSIGDGTFYNCSSLTNVIIPNSVTNIGGVAFFTCKSLMSVTIPNSVTSIGVDAFAYCTSLTNFSVDAANSVYSSLGGVLFNKAQTTLIEFPGGRGSYTIPNSVASIGHAAFSYCSLTSVTIPNSVTNIGSGAFSGCTGLTNLTFLGNAPSVGGNVFSHIAAGAKVYYYYGATGWGPTYGGLPTVMLGAPTPQVGTGSAGVKPGGFGFTLNGVTNQTIVVEASTNLVNWQPIWSSTLSTLSTNFVDPDWVNHPGRFYRLRSN
jgi:hypothetical protein